MTPKHVRICSHPRPLELMDVAFFEKGLHGCNYIKDLEIRPSWIL